MKIKAIYRRYIYDRNIFCDVCGKYLPWGWQRINLQVSPYKIDVCKNCRKVFPLEKLTMECKNCLWQDDTGCCEKNNTTNSDGYCSDFTNFRIPHEER